MIKPVSKTRQQFFLTDFQVLKGKCEKTMKNFGQPVAAAHEARLMIEDDRAKLAEGEEALYVVHQRSENRIVVIVRGPKAQVTQMPSRKSESNRSSFPLAA